jgi:hypothetical protein
MATDSMTRDESASVDATQEQQRPEPDEVAQLLIDQQGDQYALSVAAEIRRLADPQPKDDITSSEMEGEATPRRGYNIPANSASMRGYISARSAA